MDDFDPVLDQLHPSRVQLRQHTKKQLSRLSGTEACLTLGQAKLSAAPTDVGALCRFARRCSSFGLCCQKKNTKMFWLNSEFSSEITLVTYSSLLIATKKDLLPASSFRVHNLEKWDYLDVLLYLMERISICVLPGQNQSR